MLQIKNLSITHLKDLRCLLKDVSLTLNPGDKAVLIGEEGNGKSTLLKWIADPRLIESYTESHGERLLNGERLAYLPQELPEADRERTLYSFFCEQESFYDLTPKDLSRLAKTFGTEPDFFYRDQLMKTLSGGEKVKAQLMRILMDPPTVLLLDEPSNDVDLPALKLLEQLIADWEQIVLFISHDETLIENTANVVIHLEQLDRKRKSRFTVCRMPYRQSLSLREQQFGNQTRQALNDRREKEIRDEKYRRIAQKVAQAQATISRQDPHGAALLKKKMHAVKSLERRFAKEDEKMTALPRQEEAIFLRFSETKPLPPGKLLLDCTLPRLEAPDGRLLSENIRLVLRGNEKVCITGENGSGKTTLLKKLAEALLSRTDIRAAYMPQTYEDLLDPEQSPVDFLDSTGDKERRTWIRTCLGSLKYTPIEMDHPIRQLSGGQKAKVLLLKLTLSGANVLILDEPTRNFSPLSGPVIRKLLSDFPGAILSVSHDRKFMEEVCGKVLRLTPAGLTNGFTP